MFESWISVELAATVSMTLPPAAVTTSRMPGASQHAQRG